MALGTEAGRGPGHIVPDGDPAPLPKKGAQPPNFWSMFIVAELPHGSRCHLVRTTEVGLSQDDIVRDGDPAPFPKKGAEPPIFGPCLLRPNG